jgi:DNA-binding XRE family transcriptional regulator
LVKACKVGLCKREGGAVLDILNEDRRQEVARRLREARVHAGFIRALHFAREVGVNNTTYYRHESGKSGIDRATARLYANALNLSASDLVSEEELHASGPIPIVGVIGAGGKIVAMDAAEETTIATSAEMVGHIVHGNDLYPAYRHGDVVFCRPLNPKRFDPISIHGQECVCQLEDGGMILRQVIMQADGRATLIANGRDQMPALVGVNLVAAEPIEMIRRRRAPMLG